MSGIENEGMSDAAKLAAGETVLAVVNGKDAQELLAALGESFAVIWLVCGEDQEDKFVDLVKHIHQGYLGLMLHAAKAAYHRGQQASGHANNTRN